MRGRAAILALSPRLAYTRGMSVAQVLETDSDPSTFDLAELERYRTEPTYLHLVPYGSSMWKWEPTIKRENTLRLTIRWDEPSGAAFIEDIPPRVSRRGAGDLSRAIQRASGSAENHTALAQQARNHPAKWGLTPRSLQPSHVRRILTPQQIDGALPDLGAGWFAPNADSEEFGTPFAYPTRAEDGIVWQLGLVGYPDNPITATWRDDEGCKNIMETILKSTPEEQLALAALLGDSDALRAAKRSAEERDAVLKARSLFKRTKDRVKPRVLETLLGEAWNHSQGTDIQNLLKAPYYAKYLPPHVWSLQAPDVSGHMDNINAAVHVGFIARPLSQWMAKQNPGAEPHLPELEFYNGFVRIIQRRLNSKKLNYSIVRASEPHRVRFYVVANVAAFCKTRAAFGISEESVVLEQYTPGGTTMWSACG